MTPIFVRAATGGALIGTAAVLFLLTNGRIAGISGLVAGTLDRVSARWLSNVVFVLGLCGGTCCYAAVFGDWPPTYVSGSYGRLIVAGFLVGFGTRLGSGCTSGHGVCGLARLSPRSLVAVTLFVGAGIVTVAIERLLS